MKTIISFRSITVFSILLLSYSCKKIVDPGIPKSQLIANAVFENNQTATSAISGLYASLSGVSTGTFLNYQMTLLCGLMADELVAPTTSNREFYQNNLLPITTGVENLWKDGYTFIYRSNAILEGLEASEKITPSVKKQLKGEALFMRALCHFYLVNLYGDIPYLKTTNYITNNQAIRIPASLVYDKIIEDLIVATDILDETYTSIERIRPNKWTAYALLARVYLYKRDWLNAEKASAQVISRSEIYQLQNDLTQVFVNTSKETIWQLKPSLANYNTIDGSFFILNAIPTNSYLSTEFTKSFENGDLRKTVWVDSLMISNAKWYYPKKYKIKSGANPTEYLVLFRLSEQHLIRAEARSHQNNINGAIEDINKIRGRTDLTIIPNAPNQNITDLLSVIYQERKVELFVEFGHRWMDLKRTDRANTILSKLKAPNWGEEDLLLPIPRTQMDRDFNMTQNPGYN